MKNIEYERVSRGKYKVVFEVLKIATFKRIPSIKFPMYTPFYTIWYVKQFLTQIFLITFLIFSWCHWIIEKRSNLQSNYFN